uniref:Uncharacterized protein n=1 Tax=Bubo bubo TaxID=30461 RepID=A0A8C0EGA7_BUBBB
MGGFPALLLLLALPESCMAGEDTQVFLHAEGEPSRANCSYDVHNSLQEKKFWCEELSEKSCPASALSSPLKERINRNHALHRSVDVIDFGCENSGTHQCGAWGDLKNILLQRIQVVLSPEKLVKLFAKKRELLSLHCSYSLIANIRKRQCFIWCKMVSQIRCQPIIRGNSDQTIVKIGRTEMMNDFSWKMIRVWLKKLQLNDSGEYHLESHFQGRNKLLNRIMLEVLGTVTRDGLMWENHLLFGLFQGESWNWDADVANPTDDSNKDHRTLYALMVLSSFLPTTALIATVILLITTYIRRKRAGKGMDFGRHPSFRQAALQDRRSKASRMAEGELNDSTIYAVIRHQPQPKPEDVMYVNIQPSPKVFFHVQEPSGNSVSSGPVEYATVIFRASTSHSETEKRKPGPPKQSSTKPWACSQNFAELPLETTHL